MSTANICASLNVGKYFAGAAKKKMITEHANFFTYPTWKKYLVLSREIEMLKVRDKRLIFQMMRNAPDLTHDTFFPAFGFTAGEFAIWQILSEHRKPRRPGRQGVEM